MTIFYCSVRVGEEKRHSCAVQGLRGVGEGEGEAVEGGGQLGRGQHAVPALLSRLPACLHTQQVQPPAARLTKRIPPEARAVLRFRPAARFRWAGARPQPPP